MQTLMPWYHMNKESCFTTFDYCDLVNAMVPLASIRTPETFRHCLDVVSTCLDTDTDVFSHFRYI